MPRLLLGCLLLLLAAHELWAQGDWRNLATGLPIPGGKYCDQPYIVKTADGAWLCVMTTAEGAEGSATQTVLSMRSRDRGKSWSKPVALEPAGGPETSYAVLLRVPSGRVYCFYNHNSDNLRSVKTEDGKTFQRVDSLGYYVFRYSDDHGQSWSARRYVVPVREFACDRNNVYGGKVRFFWNVGRPLLVQPGSEKRRFWTDGPAALLTLHKVGAMGAGFFAQSEGVFLRSDNILTEKDPEKITFTTLPQGEFGLRTPRGGGRVAEEQSLVQLSDGSLYCVYRSVDGHPVCAYSRDGGKTWTEPAYKTYTPGGKRFKHPRAANFVWKCSNGQYLYWFHNHAPPLGQRKSGWDPYADRNPVWVAAGREQDSPAGKILDWSQPEILLYDDDPFVRISYPDLIEEEGEFHVTQTQKAIGRVHRLDPTLLHGLFTQAVTRTVARKGLLLELPASGKAMPGQVPAPQFPPLLVRDRTREDMGTKDLRAGFALEVRVRCEPLSGSRTLLDTRDAQEQGLALTAEADGSVRLQMNDGRTSCSWSSDAGSLREGQTAHVVVVVDGGPKVITFIVDGVLCDGGEKRQFGWGRFSPHFRGVDGRGVLRLGSGVEAVRIYNRALRTSEAVGNYWATMTASGVRR